MHDPKESNKAALKQVLRYLQGSLACGLVYEPKSQEGLIGYSDSSYNIDPDDGKSTSGLVVTLLLGVLRSKRS